MLGVDQPANRAFKKSFLPAAQIFLCGDPILKLCLFSCRCHPPGIQWIWRQQARSATNKQERPAKL